MTGQGGARCPLRMGLRNIGALIIGKIRIGFWGPVYYNYNKEPPK